MPSRAPDPWVDQAGCTVIEGQSLSSYRCIRCETEWSVTEEGDLLVTHGERPIPSWALDERNPWLPGDPP